MTPTNYRFFSFFMYFVGATWPYDVKKTTFFFVNEIFEEWKQEMDQILVTRILGLQKLFSACTSQR
jgi:hypothetical protein